MSPRVEDEMELLRSLKVLGLDGNATREQAKKAYRQLCKVWHPDRFPEDPDLQRQANEKLAGINAAFAVVERVMAARQEEARQAEEAARRQREQAESKKRAADEAKRKAAAEDAQARRAQEDAAALERKVRERAEALTAERVASVKQAAWILGVMTVIVAAIVSYAAGSSAASAAPSQGSETASADAALDGMVDQATLQSEKTVAYDTGYAAGKADAIPAGKYIRMDHPDYADEAKFKSTKANTWYVISLIANPVKADRSFAPYVVDAYISSSGGSATARQLKTSQLKGTVWWRYTTRKKR